MEIAPKVHSIPAASGAFLGTYPSNVYLVLGDGGALVDSGLASERDVEARLDYLKSLGLYTLSFIVVTHPHPDHLGGAKRIQDATGARLAVHPLAASSLNHASSSLRADRLVEDGDMIKVGKRHLEVVHTPGHSSGHICLHLKKEGILFSGDHILGLGTTVVQPPQGNMAQYIDSLRKLLRCEAQMICPGHGPVIREPKRKIQELLEHRRERENQVLTYLKEGQGTVEGLARRIYPELDRRLYGMAQAQVLAHLIKLEEEGRVIPLGRGEYALKEDGR